MEMAIGTKMTWNGIVVRVFGQTELGYLLVAEIQPGVSRAEIEANTALRYAVLPCMGKAPRERLIVHLGEAEMNRLMERGNLTPAPAQEESAS